MEENIRQSQSNGAVFSDADILRKSTWSSAPTGTQNRAFLLVDESFIDGMIRNERARRGAIKSRKTMHCVRSAFAALTSTLSGDEEDSKVLEKARNRMEPQPSLQRQNSTGSLHIDSMLNEPDVNASIQCMCMILHAFMSAPPAPNNATFEGCNITGSLRIFDEDHDDRKSHAAPSASDMVKFVCMVYTRAEMHVSRSSRSLAESIAPPAGRVHRGGIYLHRTPSQGAQGSALIYPCQLAPNRLQHHDIGVEDV